MLGGLRESPFVISLVGFYGFFWRRIGDTNGTY